MNEVDREWLLDMLEYGSAAVRLLGERDEAALAADERTALALSYAIQTVGEAASHVSPSCQSALAQIPWPSVIGMRHRLVHGYRARSNQVLVDTIRTHLPPKIAVLERALKDDAS